MSASCGITIAGACPTAPANGPKLPDQRCGTDDGAECICDGNYKDCKADVGAKAWAWPVTVYLNHPCDLTFSPGLADPFTDPACQIVANAP